MIEVWGLQVTELLQGQESLLNKGNMKLRCPFNALNLNHLFMMKETKERKERAALADCPSLHFAPNALQLPDQGI
jgi:hypothetical protein